MLVINAAPMLQTLPAVVGSIVTSIKAAVGPAVDAVTPVLAPLRAGFDFSGIAIILAGISFGLCGLIFAGSMMWPDTAEQYKSKLPMVFTGLILIGLSSALVSAFS